MKAMDVSSPVDEPWQPFLEFAEQILPQSVTRASITAAYRRAETDAVPMLLEQARLPQPLAEQAHKLAYQLAEKLRNQKNRQRFAPAWCRACYKSFRSLHRKGWR